MKIHEEEKAINQRLSEVHNSIQRSEETQGKIDSAMKAIDDERFQLDVFDDVIIRKLIECVKVISKNKLLIIFKGEIEVTAEIE